MLRISPEEAKNLLTNMQPGAKIELKLHTGEQEKVFSVITVTKTELLNQNYSNLLGKAISISDAAEKYGINRRTIFKWLDKGYITILVEEPIKLVDEAEVKYCVDTYRQRVGGGVPLFDENGLPYHLKHPKLSDYRRRKKQ